MKRIGILGATGYTALELIELLSRHPSCQITRLTSRDPAQPHVRAVHSRIQNMDLNLCPFDVNDLADNIDFAFSCLPHAASAASVAALQSNGIPVVDFSADYRLDDVAMFESIYNVQHPDPSRVGTVPYGLPEFFRDEIRNAKVVANPGCFPTSILLPLGPLARADLIPAGNIICDSKTGISGAGRKANLKFHFPECNESVTAYGIGKHRHRPEIENLIGRIASKSATVQFTPHLIPMDRGILSTIYLPPGDQNFAEQVAECLHDFFANEAFVKVVDSVPGTRDVARTNRCHIHVGNDRGNVIIVSVIDNLIKGASGAAVQNFNLMNGFPEDAGLPA